MLNPIYRSQKKEKEIVNSSTIVSLIDNADFRFNNYQQVKYENGETRDWSERAGILEGKPGNLSYALLQDLKPVFEIQQF